MRKVLLLLGSEMEEVALGWTCRWNL